MRLFTLLGLGFGIAALALGLPGLSHSTPVSAQGVVYTICAIPTPGYGTGSVIDMNARLSSTRQGTILSCSATIGEPRPNKPVVMTGIDAPGLECSADGLLTQVWELRISPGGHVSFKCYF